MSTQSSPQPISTISEESKSRILDFMEHHPVGVLATVAPSGDPDATTIYYATQDDFVITFITKHDTKKTDNINHNNHVILVAHEAASQTVLQVRGIAEEITDVNEANEAFRATLRASLRTSESGVPPVSKLHMGEYVAFRIRPKEIRMAVFVRPDTGGYELYETLEFAD